MSTPTRRARLACGVVLGIAGVLLSGALLPARAGEDHVAPPARPLAVQQVAADSIRYALKVTDNNLHAMTITNYGFTGNNFITRVASWEYPAGSGYEHLVRAGLWVGAHAVDDTGAFVGVSAAAVDGAQGTGSQQVTEFTPAGIEVKARSTLINNRFYNPASISELDLTSEFSDRPGRGTLNNNERHRPLNILVRQENYNWSFSDLAHFVIFHYTIKNIGLYRLTDVWAGIYAELASGNKNLYSTWPPSSSGSAVGGWYQKKWLAYDDSITAADGVSNATGHMMREHYCASTPVPDACNLYITPAWVGIKLLGVSPGNMADTSDKKVTFYASNYAPGSPPPDVARYDSMSTGRITPITGVPDLEAGSGDPVELLTVGPFAEIDPGDSIVVDFAFVGGNEIPDLYKHARSAQRAFDNHYIVPIPPQSPEDTVVVRDGAIEVWWDNIAEFSTDPTSPNPLDFEGYRVYLGEDRKALQLVAQYDVAGDTSSFNTGLAPALQPQNTWWKATKVRADGSTYEVEFRYMKSIAGLKDGFKYFYSVTAFDQGTTEIEPLESGISVNKKMVIPGPAPDQRASRANQVTVFPNPYRVEARWDQRNLVRDHYVWFTNLPPHCRVKVYTLSGDLVHSHDFIGAGYHGDNARGVYNPGKDSDLRGVALSGTTYAWNLITDNGQAIATGLYLWAVEDATGKKDRQVGKLLIVKSDRENF